ncbi:MAG: hypothetical protein PVG39_00775 [Desulfobacteraceae bacterium]|jgi:hypothetical protein
MKLKDSPYTIQELQALRTYLENQGFTVQGGLDNLDEIKTRLENAESLKDALRLLPKAV